MHRGYNCYLLLWVTTMSTMPADQRHEVIYKTFTLHIWSECNDLFFMWDTKESDLRCLQLFRINFACLNMTSQQIVHFYFGCFFVLIQIEEGTMFFTTGKDLYWMNLKILIEYIWYFSKNNYCRIWEEKVSALTTLIYRPTRTLSPENGAWMVQMVRLQKNSMDVYILLYVSTVWS